MEASIAMLAEVLKQIALEISLVRKQIDKLDRTVSKLNETEPENKNLCENCLKIIKVEEKQYADNR